MALAQHGFAMHGDGQSILGMGGVHIQASAHGLRIPCWGSPGKRLGLYAKQPWDTHKSRPGATLCQEGIQVHAWKNASKVSWQHVRTSGLLMGFHQQSEASKKLMRSAGKPRAVALHRPTCRTSCRRLVRDSGSSDRASAGWARCRAQSTSAG